MGRRLHLASKLSIPLLACLGLSASPLAQAAPGINLSSVKRAAKTQRSAAR